MSANMDVSAATAYLKPYTFCDPVHDWQVVSIKALITVAYIISQAVSINVGQVGTTGKFLDAVSLGAAAISAGVLTAELLTSTSGVVDGKYILNAGSALDIGWVQNASQTGEVQVIVRLRPVSTEYYSNRRPAAADAAA